MTPTGFGEHLRREREMRGVSLEEIAGATRISTRFLAALEKEEWGRLPGGVFNRGFVRNVARFLGLEEENLLAEYALANRQPGPAMASEPPPQPATARKAPWIALLIAGVVSVAGASWLVWGWYDARQTELAAAASAVPPAPAPPSVPPTVLHPPKAPEVRHPSPPPVVSPWASLPPGLPDGAAPRPARKLQLKIYVGQETYLTVASDGRQVFAGAVLIGQSHDFTAENALTIEAQDAGAVRLELNGQSLAPMGPPGQPGKITLEHIDAKKALGGPD